MVESMLGIISGVLLLQTVKILEILKKLSCWIIEIKLNGIIIIYNDLTVS